MTWVTAPVAEVGGARACPHATVRYPFVAPNRLAEHVIEDVRACLSTAPAFTCASSRRGWFGQEVVWLAPEPDAPFRALTKQVARQFPECPPYRGKVLDPAPHLTVGSAHLADLAGNAGGSCRAAGAPADPFPGRPRSPDGRQRHSRFLAHGEGVRTAVRLKAVPHVPAPTARPRCAPRPTTTGPAHLDRPLHRAWPQRQSRVLVLQL
ncbi:2'-5' RNA ligase family protein [Streptomyces sp. TR02-1]|uniref:2'-5' RNA ligase family protein n=1 Tax=Streptomyces sp. TR02-1 TaxID=3385977 RepID=UPI0039A03487